GPQGARAVGRRGDGGAGRPDDDFLYEIGRHIERLDAAGSVWGTFGGLGGVILPASADVRGLARLLHSTLQDILRSDRVLVAVGAEKGGATAIKDALDDAIRVLTFARRRSLT